MKKFLCLFLTAMLLLTGAVIVPISAADLSDPELNIPENSATGDYVAPQFIGIQTRVNNEGTETETQDIRFVATVASTKGKLLGFDVYANGETYNVESSTVYTTINAGDTTFSAADEGAEALFVVVITGVPTNLEKIQFDVRTYVEYGEDDTKVRSYNTTFEMNGKAFQKDLTSPALTWATQGGKGTADNPYVLTQANFETFYNYYINTGSNSFTAGQYFSLESDVVINEGTTFAAPMKTFIGTFDGNGNTISGLNVTSNAKLVALFNAVGGTDANSTAELKNLRITNSYFETTSTETYSAAATFAARIQNATIKNCYSDATVKNNAAVLTSSTSTAGGIAGYGNYTTFNISNCVFAGTAEAKGAYAGGILGAVASGKKAILTDCLNLGTVRGVYAGGILSWDVNGGSATSTLTNCINLSKTVYTVSDASDVEANFIYGRDRQLGSFSTYIVTGFATASQYAGTTNLTGVQYNTYNESHASKMTVKARLTLAEFLDSTKSDLSANGWTFQDGCIPCPIEGLEIELAPYLTQWGITLT